MFTKNFKNLFIRVLLNQTASGYNSGQYNDDNNPPTYTLINGDSIRSTTQSYPRYSFTSALNNLKTTSDTTNTAWLVIGTGTGTVSENDYALFNQTSDCTCISASSAMTSNLAKAYTATFQNTSDTDITITETGMVSKIVLNSDPYVLLLDHTLLETPVAIPAGESRTITYILSF